MMHLRTRHATSPAGVIVKPKELG